MKKLSIGFILILAAFSLTACGDYEGDTSSAGDTTLVNVDGNVSGDLTLNIGSGSATITKDGECILNFTQDDAEACTIEEKEEALENMDTSYTALARTI